MKAERELRPHTLQQQPRGHVRKPSLGPLANLATAQIVCEGWVLKKRRKKMQGFARRYFTLYQNGLLVYAFEPGQPVRDHLFLQTAAIATTPGRRDIHVDSEATTFHIKCLSSDDFNRWMGTFRKFIQTSQEAIRTTTLRHATRQASIQLNRSGALIEELGQTISELDKAVAQLTQDYTHLKGLTAKKSEKPKESKFGLFKRPNHHDHTPGTPDSASIHHGPDVVDSIQTLLDLLKTQHINITKTFETLPQPSVLSTTAEEDEGVHPVASPIPTHRSIRDSVFSSESAEWFDAVEDGFNGPQEFVLDPGVDGTGTEPGSRIVPESINDSQTSFHSQDDRSSVDTDIHEQELSPATADRTPCTEVKHRTRLPALPPADEGSLFTILKKNVGKDLATITLPVTFNEPLTLLQRAAEEVEYFSLLDEAARSEDTVKRLAYIAAFAVSSYAHTKHRSGRKGFNPMLAETFEDVRMNFIAEKVRHNPLEIAYHAAGHKWDLTSTTLGRTKFWGKSLEIIPLGTTRVTIGTDTFTWKKPSSFMRNLMVGTKYFEHSGQMTIENSANDWKCLLDFKPNGYWGPTNVVTGAIHDPNGNIVGRLEGKWDDQFCQILDDSHLHVLWKMTPFPKDQQDYYGFTSFGVTLNEITPDIEGKLPPTDSRLRPDVCALENGDLDLAEEKKNSLEQLQRDRRAKGQTVEPRWFKHNGEDWEYVGGYWEQRSDGSRKSPPPRLW